MEIIRNFTEGKMDKDVDVRLIPKGVYRDALNIRIASSDGEDAGAVRKVKGTEKWVDLSQQDAPFVCLGAKVYKDEIYAFYLGGSGDTYLFEIDRLTQTYNFLLQEDLGNSATDIINDIELIENNDSERLIYWNDKVGPPRSANVTTLRATPAYYSIEALNLIKAPPVYAPEILNLLTTEGYELQYKDQIQTAYQFIYENGEESAVSFYSETIFDNKDQPLAIDFVNVITLDDAAAGKIYVSDDFGVSYTNITPGGAPWNEHVLDYCINFYGNKMWLISTDNTAIPGQPYKSVDQGLTWKQYYGGAQKEWRRIRCDSAGRNVYSIYITIDDIILVKSVDGESGWISIDSIPRVLTPPTELTVNSDGSVVYYIGTTNKIRVSRDYGTTFIEYNLPATFATADIIRSLRCNSLGNIAYLQDRTLKKFYRSSDYGQTWVDISYYPLGPAYNGYAIDASGVIIYALALDVVGGNIQRLLVSKNAGNTWSHLATFTVGGAIVDSDIECTPDGSKGLFALDNGSINGYYFESDGTIEDLDGSVVYTQANVPEQAEIDTVTFDPGSSSGTANITCDTLTRTATWDTDINITAQNFVTDHAAAYDARDITLTSAPGGNLNFTGQAGKGAFTGAPTIVNVVPDLDGTVDNFQEYVAAQKRIDTVTLTGIGGTAEMLCDAVTRNVIFNGTLTQTATDFVTVNAAAYLAGGVVVTSSGADIIFTSTVAGVDFTGATTITNIGRAIYGLHIQLQQTLANVEREKFYLRNDISGFDMRIETGNKHVDKIRLLYRYANTTTWRVLDELDKGLLSIADNTTYDYTFDKSAFNRILSENISGKLYDNVPHRANAMALINNQLVFGGYRDGYTLDITPAVTGRYFTVTEQRPAGRTGLSLKTGTTQKYVLVYYDEYNRSSAPLVDPVGSIITFSRAYDPVNPRRAARITIGHLPPTWAVKYKVLRARPIIDYRFITDMTDIKAVNDKLYLYIGATEGGYAIGDKLEAVSFKSGSLVDEDLFVEVEDIVFKDIAFANTDAGYWVVITPPATGVYSLESVLNGSSAYPFTVFYLIKYDLDNPESIYLETSETFAVTAGYHMGNTQNQTVAQDAILDLIDGDVFWAESPYHIEKFQVGESIPYNALGRGMLLSDNFKQINRYASLTFSDVFVPDTGFNGLSSFNLARVNYKDLNIGDGAIILIDEEYTNLLVLQEDFVSKVLVNKDILQTASGEGLVSGSKLFLGQQIPYAGDYGCQDPAAFARWGNAKYFPDKKRGVILRLSQDGLTEISRYGFRDYFNDLFKTSGVLKGAYDPRHSEYILHDVDNVLTIGFSEPENGFPAFFSYMPDYIVNGGDQMWSFKNEFLYKHNATDVYNNFYGVQYTSKIVFVFNEEPDILKVIESISLHSDSAWVVNHIKDRFRLTDIPSANFENKEGFFFAAVPKAVGTARANVVTDNISTQGLGTAVSPIPTDWFLPSKDELKEMHDELHAFGVGGFTNKGYWTSTEFSATQAWIYDFDDGNPYVGIKSWDVDFRTRACRSFIGNVGDYSMRDSGPAGGLIFAYSGGKYYESVLIDQSTNQRWSNIINVLIGTTSDAIGEGQNNTNEIIGQAGHIDSAAKLCDDYSNIFYIIVPVNNIVSVGDIVSYYDSGWILAGTITEIENLTDGTMKLVFALGIPGLIVGKLAIAQKNSYLEGDSLRDYYFELELEHAGNKDTELFSVIAEVKQSKQ